MEFTNDTIDINSLPKFEEVNFSSLHKDYLKIVTLNSAIIMVVFAALICVLLYFEEALQHKSVYYGCAITYVISVFVVFFASRASVKKRGFAIREKDILYKRGIISTTTTIIPFNRIQHVAIHEGFFSRMFNLAQLQIFTAGGSSSDVLISGIKKQNAENIKEMLMQKIQNPL